MEQVRLSLDLDRDRTRFLLHESHTLDLPSLFYGSLRAPEIFEIVVGRPMETATIEPVSLPGHELARIIAGDGFPGIFPAETEDSLSCLLISDLSPRESLRVAWFEWEEYKLGRFSLSDGRTAQAFVPNIDVIRALHGSIDFHPWSFEEWRDRHLVGAIPNAQVWMAEMPDVTAMLVDDEQSAAAE